MVFWAGAAATVYGVKHAGIPSSTLLAGFAVPVIVVGAGIVGAGLVARYLGDISKAHGPFEAAFGEDGPERPQPPSRRRSLPASAPVCDSDASAATACRPAFKAMTGLMRAAARRLLMKRRESLMPSMYSRIALVRWSATR